MLKGLTIILFIVSVLFIYFPKYKNELLEKHKILKVIFDKDFSSFIINICVTVIGVTLAIFLTNYDVERQENNKTISLLASLERELEMIEDNINEFYIPAYEQLKEQGSEDKFFEMYLALPITPLYTLDSIMENEIVVTNTNYYSYAALVDSERSIYASYSRLDLIEDIESLVLELNVLSESCAFMRNIILTEIQFQKGDISENDMKEMIYSIYEGSIIGK